MTGLLRMLTNTDLFDSNRTDPKLFPGTWALCPEAHRMPRAPPTPFLKHPAQTHSQGLCWTPPYTSSDREADAPGEWKSHVKTPSHLSRIPRQKEDKKMNGVWYPKQNYWKSWSHSNKDI